MRLSPSGAASVELVAITRLFNHRLSASCSQHASQEWQSIVDGTSPLWSKIPSSKSQLIRSFFNLLNLEILKRSRPPTSTFDFTSASIGNLFLTGARLFSGSFESAIYLLSTICDVSDEQVRVIPVINSNFTHHIAAGLADGSVIIGQNSISHPSEPTALEPLPSPPLPTSTVVTGARRRWSRHSLGDPEAVLTDDEASRVDSQRNTTSPEPGSHEHEDANLPCSLPTLRSAAIKFSKRDSLKQDQDLPSRIERIWYINPYGQEILPAPNPRVCEAIGSAKAIIYSIGSLYTSIIPSLVLRGVGEAICRNSRAAGAKILILNGALDREVGPQNRPFTAADFVEAIVQAGEQSKGVAREQGKSGTSVSCRADTAHVGDVRDDSCSSTKPISNQYIDHVVYLAGPGTPIVDTVRLQKMGISCIQVQAQEVEVAADNGDEAIRDKCDTVAMGGPPKQTHLQPNGGTVKKLQLASSEIPPSPAEPENSRTRKESEGRTKSSRRASSSHPSEAGDDDEDNNNNNNQKTKNHAKYARDDRNNIDHRQDIPVELNHVDMHTQTQRQMGKGTESETQERTKATRLIQMRYEPASLQDALERIINHRS